MELPGPDRNLAMAARIEQQPTRDLVSFVVVGDSGAWPDPTADAILAQLFRQAATATPAPAFLVNLGDFAGPGTQDRHDHYLRRVAALPIPDLCVIGNHDLDDPAGRTSWSLTHGPTNYQFGYSHTRFIALDAPPRETSEGTTGPSAETLAFLDRSLDAAKEPNRVVLLHPPPQFGDRYHPHPEWGFNVGEAEFLDLVERHHVTLVCSAHALFFDHHVHHGTQYVVSGGGGTALCSHFRGVCAPGSGAPEDRGALFHAVHLTISPTGDVCGRVLQAFGDERGALSFGT